MRYGVIDVLERHYDGMRRHLEYLRAGSTDLIRSAGRYGDWVGLEGMTPKGVIGTAFFAHCARTLGRIAGVLGDGQGRADCEELHDRIRNAFIERFVGEDGAIAGSTQVGHVLALHMDLVPDSLRAATADLLAADVEARGGHLADVTVPPNTTADVILPGERAADLGSGIRIASGRHRFRSPLSVPAGMNV